MNKGNKRGPAPRTHCRRGHPYDDENTVWASGRRYCRICRRANSLSLTERRRNGTVRHERARGERHGKAKLTEDQVRAVRHLAAQGATKHSLAETFGVHPQTVYYILRGTTWQHVPPTRLVSE